MTGLRPTAFLVSALTLLGACPAGSKAAERLTAAERRIVAAVDRGTPAALDLLERAVNINSGTMNFAGVRAVARLFEPAFADLGFKTRWAEGAAWGRAGHLIATRPGRAGGLRVLLIGHLDTVFERDSPFQRFERLTDSTAHGPGVIDMKGGDVIMLLALAALEAGGGLHRLQVTALLTRHHEESGQALQLARRCPGLAAHWG